MKQILKKQDGFAFAGTAIVVALILGFLALYLANSVSLNITESAETYSAYQSYWGAISGIDYSLQKMQENELNQITGNYRFYNDSIALSVHTTDRLGNSLPYNQRRIVSAGSYGDALRRVEVTLAWSAQDIWPDTSRIITGGAGSFILGSGANGQFFTLNDTIYIGDDVNIVEPKAAPVRTRIGFPDFGDPTHIYIPTGDAVTMEADVISTYITWSETSSLNLPPFGSFRYPAYDSLLNIAQSITATSGNKFSGNKNFDEITLDLSQYDHNTIFVNGIARIRQGTQVINTGGSIFSPGIIVADGDIIVNNSTVVDNVILIANGNITISNNAQFGSALSSSELPKTVNEMYARESITVSANSIVRAEVISFQETDPSLNDIILNGQVYGVVYAGGILTFNNNNSFLEGAMFVNSVLDNRLQRGEIDLNHFYPTHHFSTGVTADSLREN